jgi:5-hydroxyisourate hydrolase-like protein (transthyretin family)
MNRRRTAVAALAGVATLVIAPQALPASASGPVPGSAAVEPPQGQALIQGVVTDQSGNPVDDVTVQATKADGTPAASALTYASDRADGPQHGYFYLQVTRGTYTLTFTKDGYRGDPLEAQVTKRGQHVSLGEIEIRKVLAETKTSADLVKATVTTKQNGEVEVSVTSKATGKPTGDVEIREGRHVVGEGQVKSRDKGAVSLELDKLGKGEHDLKAYYLGSSTLKPSSSKSFTLTVKKAGKKPGKKDKR